MALQEIHVPDIGDYDQVDVIEVNVSPGDTIEEEDSLITLETDKASMEVPSPVAGTVKELSVKVGDKVSKGDLIMYADVGQDQSQSEQQQTKQSEAVSAQKADTGQTVDVEVPDIGDYDQVDVIEVNVSPGDTIEEEDSLITLETDKASMEVPAPFGGQVNEITVNVGDKVSQGDVIMKVVTQSSSEAQSASEKTQASEEKDQTSDDDQKASQQPAPEPSQPEPPQQSTPAAGDKIYASPAVRRLARVLGVDLNKVPATGPKGRITKEDCNRYIKKAVNASQKGEIGGAGLDLLEDPDVDFSKFGETETEPLSKINKLSAKNLHRNWVKIPHVTFYDDADITELEEFRKAKKTVAEKQGVKLTPVVFLIKAAAKILEEFPRFNSSLTKDGEHLVLKKYVNIGFAVDTPNGLIVPVIKNANHKTIFQIAEEYMDIVSRSQKNKVKPDEMKGACFTISSLGVLGTTGFTPIINMPEVAIMGVSKSTTKPVYNGQEFEPRLMLPLSLSVDHRVIDGALAAKFLTRYCQLLNDLREMLL